MTGALSFPEHHGANLDALRDCLDDVAEVAYGWAAADTGLILVLDGFDRFHGRDPREALAVLEILGETGRRSALCGNRILSLLRTDDADARYGPIGGRDVSWNPEEAARSARTS